MALVTRPLAHGRPGTRVIPAGWAAQHRPTAEGTMTGAVCEIREPDTVGAFDTNLGRRPITPGTLVRGNVPCRVVRVNREQVHSLAEQQVTTLDYLVTVPLEVLGARVDHVVRFTSVEPGGDTDLLTTKLIVTAVLKGTQVWERDLYCIESQG